VLGCISIRILCSPRRITYDNWFITVTHARLLHVLMKEKLSVVRMIVFVIVTGVWHINISIIIVVILLAIKTW